MTYNFNLDYSSQHYALSLAFYLPYIFQMAVTTYYNLHFVCTTCIPRITYWHAE